MNQQEEELQNAIENGETPEAEGPDARAYRALFGVLKTPGPTPLPADFADRVARRIIHRQKQMERRDYLWYALGVLLLGVAGGATILYTGFRFDFDFLSPIANYKGLGMFAIVFIVFLNWVDERFVRSGLGRWRHDHGHGSQ